VRREIFVFVPVFFHLKIGLLFSGGKGSQKIMNGTRRTLIYASHIACAQRAEHGARDRKGLQNCIKRRMTVARTFFMSITRNVAQKTKKNGSRKIHSFFTIS
jgi:hypothetical protein